MAVDTSQITIEHQSGIGSIPTSLLVILVFCITQISIIAQTTKLEGRIVDKLNGESIPFVNIHLKGTSIGTVSDTSGMFSLSIPTNKIRIDSIVVSHLIYDNKIIAIRRNEEQFIEIALSSDFLLLNEVVIKPGENPAWPILRNVITNKSINNPKNKQSYYYQEYSKTRFDLNHFTDKLKKNILVKPFDYIWDNVNHTEEGVPYLPLLLVEKVVDHYYQFSPSQAVDYIQASNTVGLPGKKMLEFTEDLYFTPNFYENYVVMLDKNFPSPINDNYKQNYHFYLLDSVPSATGKQYKIAFKPKSKRSLAFTGEMSIDSITWALKDIQVQFNIQANINFVRSYLLQQQFTLVDAKHWMLAESSVLGDFTVMENVSDMTGFFGRKKSIYSNHQINIEISDKLFNSSEAIVTISGATTRPDSFWVKARPATLTKEESGIVTMIDRLETDPKYLLRKNLIKSMISGYIPMRKYEVGNLYTFYSSNSIEKSRIKLGIRTSDGWERLQAYVFGAYGTHDERWKYGGRLKWALNEGANTTSFIKISYNNDLDQLGRSPNQLPLDHILSSWVQLNDFGNSVNYKQRFELELGFNGRSGLSSGISYFDEKLERAERKKFVIVQANGIFETLDLIQTSGIQFQLKYQWQNKETSTAFYDKADLKNVFRKYPDIGLQITLAGHELFPSEYDFTKIRLSLRQQIRLKKYGYTKYFLEAGKTFGDVAYPHLDIPFGNPLVFNDDQAFNLMKFMEYVADEYVIVDLQHHFDGLILDRLPGIQKLKWRSFIFGKTYIGNLSNSNNEEHYRFPFGLEPIDHPYIEVGFGIENIFKIARMDFIWRITDRNKFDTYNFLVKPSFSFSF